MKFQLIFLAKGQETINVTAKISESADIEETEIVCVGCSLLISKNKDYFSASIIANDKNN